MKFYVYAFLISLSVISSTLFAQTTTNCTGAAAWDVNTAYNGGTQVKYNNVLYTANWWTQGNQPDVNSGATGSGLPWLIVGTCGTTNKGTRTASVTSSSSGIVSNTISLTYSAVPSATTGTWTVTNGTGTATLSGSTLTLASVGTVTVTVTIAEDANYYAVTASQTITITAASTPPLDCSYIGIWDAALVYDGGDQAKIDGILYQAKWWTQGNNPSTDYGTTPDKHWTLVGTCTTGGTSTNIPWMINGNHNATTTSFIGTTNSQYLSFKSNNIEGMRLHPFGTLQLGGFTANAITDGYFRADITGRVAMRPDPGVNQNNVLLLYSNNQTTARYTAGFKHYTGFSHVLLGTTEVGVMNVVEFNSTSGVTVGKHLLLQNTAEGNLGIGVFSSIPTAKLSVNGTSYLNGSVTVGTNYLPTGFMMSVQGKIIAEEVHVKLRASWPDFVFSKDYSLMPLYTLQTYINEHHHLPGVPSAEEVKNEGITLGEMDATLLKKVEELTLYLLQQNEIIQQQQKQIESLQKQMNTK